MVAGRISPTASLGSPTHIFPGEDSANPILLAAVRESDAFDSDGPLIPISAGNAAVTYNNAPKSTGTGRAEDGSHLLGVLTGAISANCGARRAVWRPAYGLTTI